MNLHWEGSANRPQTVIQHIWTSILVRMMLFCCSVLIKTIQVEQGTRYEAAFEILLCSFQTTTFTAMKDSHRHVEGCWQKDSSDVLHQMKYKVKDNKDITKRN